MPVMGVTKFERFFRAAAGLRIDKNDVKRYDDFINRKIYDLFLIAQTAARANGRDIVEPEDLPLGKGLQECVHTFRELDEEIELKPLLDRLTAEPAVDLAASEQTRAELPQIAGGLSVALARLFRVIEPERHNPDAAEWEKADRIFDLFL
ncbi:MAG TPA: DUF1931 family protein [Actinospica sp.]|nr:DUF1931 family protein [Actinospica sp.]